MFIHKNFSRSLRFVVMTLEALPLSLGAWAQNISVSGTVTAIKPHIHPNGTEVTSIFIENDKQRKHLFRNI